MERPDSDIQKKRVLVVKVLDIELIEEVEDENFQESDNVVLGVTIGEQNFQSESFKFDPSHLHSFEPAFSFRIPQISNDLLLVWKLFNKSNDSESPIVETSHQLDISQIGEKQIIHLVQNSNEVGKLTLQLGIVDQRISERKLSSEFSSSQEDMIPDKLKALARSMRLHSLKNDKSNKKNKSFRKIFSLPETETVFWDCSAALRKQILHHGRLYLSKNYICFYSNVFSIKVVEAIPFSEVNEVEKQTLNIVNPGIVIRTTKGEFVFASFLSREKALVRVVSLWKEFSSPSEEDTNEEEDTQTTPSENISEEDELTMAVENENASILKNELQEIATAEFPVSLQTFFEMIYSDDSDFAKKFHEKTSHREVTIEKWTKSPQNGIFRNITFKSPTGSTIGPTTTRVDETQRYELSKTKLLVETVSVMSDVPYADCFRIEGKHDLVPLDNQNCKYTISGGVHFTKKTLFEGKIRSQSMKQMKESFQTWISLANEELQQRMNPKEEIPANSEVKTDSNRNDIEPTISMKKEKETEMLSYIPNSPIYTVVLIILVAILYIQVFNLSSRVSELEQRVSSVKS